MHFFLILLCKTYLKRSFCQLTKARWKIKIEAWALSGRPTLLKRLGPSKQCCINFPQEKVVEKVWDKKLTISYDPSFVYFFMEICCWWTRLNNTMGSTAKSYIYVWILSYCIGIVLIDIKYQKCRRTLNVNLLLAI